MSDISDLRQERTSYCGLDVALSLSLPVFFVCGWRASRYAYIQTSVHFSRAGAQNSSSPNAAYLQTNLSSSIQFHRTPRSISF